jgi:hypothetical protein
MNSDIVGNPLNEDDKVLQLPHPTQELKHFKSLIEWALKSPEAFENLDHRERVRIAKLARFEPFKIIEWSPSEIEQYLKSRRIESSSDVEKWPVAKLLQVRKLLPQELLKTRTGRDRVKSSDKDRVAKRIERYVKDVLAIPNVTQAILERQHTKLAGRIHAAQLTKEVYESLGWDVSGLRSISEKQLALRPGVVKVLQQASNKPISDLKKIQVALYQQATRGRLQHVFRAWLWNVGLLETELRFSHFSAWTANDGLLLLDALDVTDYQQLVARWPKAAAMLHRKGFLAELAERLGVTNQDVRLPGEEVA